MSLKIMLYLPLLMVLLAAGPGAATSQNRIRCAGTTSTQNSGFFHYIVPLYEQQTGVKVDVVATGTGAALEIGKRGDADVVFVHSKEQELRDVAAGHFVHRHDVMYNDFLLIGPAADPLNLRDVKTAGEAFARIARQGYAFVSRGDRSGTNIRELAIWKAAAIEPRGQKWYLQSGQGQEKTQRIADERRAYALTDRSTWLATKDKDRLEMAVILEGDPVLFNQYGVMAVNPEKHPGVKYPEAVQFVDWLISPEGQQAIGKFKDEHGNQLFKPDAQ